MARSRRNDDWDDGYDDEYIPDRRRSREETDVFGVVGIVLGIVAVVCLLMGCFTCGMTYFAAAPLAAVGTGCSAFGRGNMRVGGLVLNILTLIPAIALLGMMLFGAGMGAIAPPPQR